MTDHFVTVISFVIFVQGFWSRFFPIYNHLRDELTSKSIGEVHTVLVNFGYDLRHKQRLTDPAMGAGALLDVGCYTVQLATMIFNERPERICASGTLSEQGGWHHNDVAWAAWHRKSPANRLFVQQFVQAYIKGNIKARELLTFAMGIHR